LLKDFAPAKRQALASFLAIFDLANDHGCGGVVASKYSSIALLPNFPSHKHGRVVH
jgi:hypothetical protein